MSNPRALSPDANAGDLTSWLTEWAQTYPCGCDDILMELARPTSEEFGLPELVDIYS